MPRATQPPGRAVCVISTTTSDLISHDLKRGGTHMSAKAQASAGGSEIRPFTIDIPDKELTALRERILATRWPEKETVGDQSQGVQLETMQNLARYWASGYDWRKCEA